MGEEDDDCGESLEVAGRQLHCCKTPSARMKDTKKGWFRVFFPPFTPKQIKSTRQLKLTGFMI